MTIEYLLSSDPRLCRVQRPNNGACFVRYNPVLRTKVFDRYNLEACNRHSNIPYPEYSVLGHTGGTKAFKLTQHELILLIDIFYLLQGLPQPSNSKRHCKVFSLGRTQRDDCNEGMPKIEADGSDRKDQSGCWVFTMSS